MKTKILLLTLLLAGYLSHAQNTKSFAAPAASFRPKVLWQWSGGMISKEGIRKDLEAMAGQGVGGAMIMQMPDQAPHPLVWSYRNYPGKLRILSNEWFNIVNFAVGEAGRLGLTLEIFLCPGWNYAGGTWVTAEKSLKKLAQSKITVAGPELQNLKLPKAPVPGIWWNLPEWHKDFGRKKEFEKYYYQDVAVIATPHAEAGKPVDLQKIINLTGQMKADGTLNWKVPEGKWDLWRMALVTANALNHPAPIEALGQESDRMDPEAVKLVVEGMVGRIDREAKAKGYHAFKGYETDSYESGYQDFALDYAAEFRKRRGYDCTRWLPAWEDASLIINDSLQTKRFKYDMKITISELQSERFYGTLQKLAKEKNLDWKLQPYFTIGLDWRSISARAHSGSEFWVSDKPILDGTAPETAVLYGQKTVWAEAFTAEADQSAWRNDPKILKPVADFAFSKGINDFYMHGFFHNPFPEKYQPGIQMGYWGTQLSRHVTWWRYSKAWHTYLARCSYLLQQGTPTVDALAYPSAMEVFPHVVESPYRITTLTDDVLLDRLYVKNGRLMLPSGISCPILIINPDRPLRLEALQKIEELVNAGATVVGDAPPAYAASLAGYPQSDAQIKSLIQKLWGSADEHGPREVKIGKGRLVSGKSVTKALSELLGAPDVTGANVFSAHRNLKNGELFFISNQKDQTLNASLKFKVKGLQPEWWDAITGKTRLLTNFSQEGDRTLIPLSLGSHESGFVVFQKPIITSKNTGDNFPKQKVIQTLKGSWDVSFDSKWGGPAKTQFDSLMDWSKSADSGIRYYSGTAIYTKQFDLTGTLPSILNLGSVHNIAEVTLNGKNIGTIWCAPWQLTISKGLLKLKNNKLEIRVANTWVNRLIGDEQYPEDVELVAVNTTEDRTGGYKQGIIGKGLKDLPDWLIQNTPRPSSKRYTFSSWKFYDRDAPLQTSGLLGPVTLEIIK